MTTVRSLILLTIDRRRIVELTTGKFERNFENIASEKEMEMFSNN